MSKTLEEKLVETATQAIIKKIADGYWLRLSSGSIKIDDTFLKKIYDSIDMDKVLEICTHRLEEKLADKILNSMATEVSTDVKNILSDTRLREEIRFYLRRKINEKAENLT